MYIFFGLFGLVNMIIIIVSIYNALYKITLSKFGIELLEFWKKETTVETRKPRGRAVSTLKSIADSFVI